MAGEYTHWSLRPGPQVSWAVIDRQVDRNSINSPVMAELEVLLEEVEASGAQVLVFTGAGSSHFIGGADGIEMMQLDRAGGLAFSRRFQALLDRMEASPLLLVAAINGLCFGGGFEFAMACDLRVAAHGARIGLPEVKVGLIPGGGGTQRLPRLVGQGLAMEMILSGKLHPGQDAARMGLVHRAVPDGELEQGVDALLEPILRNPAYALSLAKRAVKAGQGRPLDQGLRAEAELFSECHTHSFFRDLMHQQLDSGALSTSADPSELTKEESK
ncbi:MAG: enoyl-CoA hydratase/isomerase family protein [Deltaproteobacteria bacterium]|nr:enoyl-CoA hydratase/isomerase family protein [Deltaproteobacteria bacterium]